MCEFIPHMLFLSGNGVGNGPVFFQKVAFVYEVRNEGKAVHIEIDQWIFELCEGEDDISTCSSDQILWMVEESDGLGQQRKSGVSLSIHIDVLR